MKISKIIIGFEVHIELKTNSKMFCGCSARHFGKEPNTLTCPVCLGLPGALPVPNKKAIQWTILLGLAMGGEIQKYSYFERKNYFYPDLPKGYQISQYRKPFILGGSITLKNNKKVRIRRIHLEEDTGKLIHQRIDNENYTLIDFNRSGVPLVEIVSEPDLENSDEAKEYLEKIQQLVRYLEISDGDMEKGSMRCEPNVNLEIEDNGALYYTPIVELKNINSFRFVKKAIDYEVQRLFEEFKQTRITKARGNKQTRGWDESKQITVPQREKEEENDYRYFPEPDIPPFEWSPEDINFFHSILEKYELPWVKREKFIKTFHLSEYQADILTQDKQRSLFFEESANLALSKNIDLKKVANLIINKKYPENLTPTKLIEWIEDQEKVPVLEEKKLQEIILQKLAQNPKAVEGYKKGKLQALGIIVGEIKKDTGIIVTPEQIAGIIDKKG